MEEQRNVENVEDSNGKDGGIVKMPSVKRPPPPMNPTPPTNKSPKQQQKTQTTSR